MLSNKNLVSTMISQHRTLQKDLGLVNANLEISEKMDFKSLVALLDKFKKDLEEHLALENGVFYVELLEKMEKIGQDTSKTKMFISEMGEIEKVVLAFLEEYNESLKIENNLNKFKQDLPQIIDTLNLRIESEEAGVYAYWALF